MPLCTESPIATLPVIAPALVRPFRPPANPAFLQLLIDHLPVLVFVRALSGRSKGRFCVWNVTAELTTGYMASEVVGRSASDVFDRKLAAALDALDNRMINDPMVIEQVELPFPGRNGDLRLMHCVGVPLFDSRDHPEYLLCIAEDVTDTRAQSRALVARQAELSAAYDASPLGLFQTDVEGRCTSVNRRYELISGLSQSEALGNGWIGAIHPQDRLRLFCAWRDYLSASSSATESEGHLHLTYRFRHRDGRIVWASMKTAPVIIDRRVQAYSGTVEDVTARVYSERALAESEQRLRTVADTLPALLAWVDADLSLRFCNRAFEREYKLDAQDGDLRSLQDVLPSAEYRALLPYLQRALAGETVVFERESGKDASYRCVESTFIPQRPGPGRPVAGLHIMVQDITSRKLEQLRLEKLAELDTLTGLYNREGFRKRISQALARSARDGSLLAVMFLDLDHFKSVNDKYGHHTGDLLLQAFAKRLTQALRGTDTVARMGGDEFVAIMENLAREEDAEAIASKIMHTVQTPFVLEGVAVSVGVSVGLAFCHDGNADPTVLLQRADAMLYDAKQDGRNGWRSREALSE